MPSTCVQTVNTWGKASEIITGGWRIHGLMIAMCPGETYSFKLVFICGTDNL